MQSLVLLIALADGCHVEDRRELLETITHRGMIHDLVSLVDDFLPLPLVWDTPELEIHEPLSPSTALGSSVVEYSTGLKEWNIKRGRIPILLGDPLPNSFHEFFRYVYVHSSVRVRSRGAELCSPYLLVHNAEPGSPRRVRQIECDHEGDDVFSCDTTVRKVAKDKFVFLHLESRQCKYDILEHVKRIEFPDESGQVRFLEPTQLAFRYTISPWVMAIVPRKIMPLIEVENQVFSELWNGLKLTHSSGVTLMADCVQDSRVLDRTPLMERFNEHINRNVECFEDDRCDWTIEPFSVSRDEAACDWPKFAFSEQDLTNPYEVEQYLSFPQRVPWLMFERT